MEVDGDNGDGDNTMHNGKEDVSNLCQLSKASKPCYVAVVRSEGTQCKDKIEESESKTSVLVQTVNSSKNNNKRTRSCNGNENKKIKKCSEKEEENNEILCCVCGVLCNKETHICDVLQFVPSIEYPKKQINENQKHVETPMIQNPLYTQKRVAAKKKKLTIPMYENTSDKNRSYELVKTNEIDIHQDPIFKFKYVQNNLKKSFTYRMKLEFGQQKNVTLSHDSIKKIKSLSKKKWDGKNYNFTIHCVNCVEEFSKKEYFQIHFLSCYGKYCFHCSFCNTFNIDNENINNHIENHMKNVPKFYCSICKKIFLTELNLEYHKLVEHVLCNFTYSKQLCDKYINEYMKLKYKYRKLPSDTEELMSNEINIPVSNAASTSQINLNFLNVTENETFKEEYIILQNEEDSLYSHNILNDNIYSESEEIGIDKETNIFEMITDHIEVEPKCEIINVDYEQPSNVLEDDEFIEQKIFVSDLDYSNTIQNDELNFHIIENNIDTIAQDNNMCIAPNDVSLIQNISQNQNLFPYNNVVSIANYTTQNPDTIGSCSVFKLSPKNKNLQQKLINTHDPVNIIQDLVPTNTTKNLDFLNSIIGAQNVPITPKIVTAEFVPSVNTSTEYHDDVTNPLQLSTVPINNLQVLNIQEKSRKEPLMDNDLIQDMQSPNIVAPNQIKKDLQSHPNIVSPSEIRKDTKSPNIVSTNEIKNNEIKSFSMEVDISIANLCHIHCITCKRMFKISTYFNKHFFICSKRIDFQCMLCGKHKLEIEDNVSHLISHFNQENDVTYCYKCNMGFYGVYNAKEHEKMCPIKPPVVV